MADNKTSDHDVVARLYKAACARVGQGRYRGGVEIVGFDQPDAGAAILSSQNDGVLSRIERGNDRGFEIVGRLEAGRFDFAFLRVFPVVVAHEERVALIKVEGWISQEAGQWETGGLKRRTNAPNADLFRRGDVGERH